MSVSHILQSKLPELKSVIAQNEFFTNARVFGSVAHGTDTTESDIDILVEVKASYTYFDYMKFKFQLEDLLGVKVDLVDEQSLKSIVKNTIKSIIPI